MEERRILFGLHQIEGIGWQSIASINLYFAGKYNEILSEEGKTELSSLLTKSRVKAIVDRLDEQFIMAQWERYKRQDITVITILDESYPELLREINKPPFVLYCKGNIDLLYKKNIAIVGTRSPTIYGKRSANELSRKLSSIDWCVVSGLARGIDSIAHQGALKGRGGTIAVLGSGINVVYPPEHALLYEEIVQGGLIVSEYPLDTMTKPGMFPERNRIISGLSLGTLVVEAAEKSGSLITATYATEQNREVFAIPGSIASPKSAGAMALIKDGAKIVTCVEDIINEFRLRFHIGEQPLEEVKIKKKDLTKSEKVIYDIIGHEPIKFDEIMAISEFSFGQLHSVLLHLSIKSYIEQVPGEGYVTI